MTNANALFPFFEATFQDTGLTVNLEHTLNNPNAETDAFFGNAVAVSGNYAVVGAEGANFFEGKAYVFNITTGALVSTLNNPDAAGSDIFGDKVGISGNFVVIGATQNNRAYIFNATTGSLIHTLINPDPDGNPSGDGFGWDVGISGQYAIVTARRENEPTATNSGKAYIFDVSTGGLIHTLNNPNPYGSPDFDQFGEAAAISGNYAIVSATNEDEATALTSGKAYIFNVSTGNLVHTLDNPNAYGSPDSDSFGYAVDISGNYAIVSAKSEDEATASSSGKAYIFNVSTGKLVRTLDNPNAYGSPDNDEFGYSVGISGNYAIVSANAEDEATASGSGKVYIFNINTGALVATINNPNAYASPDNDFFGESVSVSGNYAIVGAFLEDDAVGNNSGKAYIYNLEHVPGYDASVDTIYEGAPGTNELVVALEHTIENPNAFGSPDFDYFANSVDISGNYAIIGSEAEDTATENNSGKAYIINVTTGQTVHTLDNPNPGANDFFGERVAISGNYAVVGASSQDVTAVNSGRAYIYNVSTGALVHTLDNPNPYESPDFDAFGRGVAVSGNYAIIGASGEDVVGFANTGRAYIYNVSTGVLVHTLDNPSPVEVTSNFGNIVDISGNYAIVGLPSYDEPTANNSGRAYIYNVSTGALVHTLDNPNVYGSPDSDSFGVSVAISGNYAIVGASGEDPSSGRVYVFNVSTGTLINTLSNPRAFSTVLFGYSVDISGHYAMVASDEPSLEGVVYIFNVITGDLVSTVINPGADSADDDTFGYSLAISGKYSIVGAYQRDEPTAQDSGRAYIFNLGNIIGYDASVDITPPSYELQKQVNNSNYTFVLGDQKSELHVSTDASAYTWTIPPATSEAFLVGSILTVYNGGTGNITIARGTGVSLRQNGDSVDENKTLPQYTIATITKIDTDSWVISGI